jgi:hypothetical protein
MAHFAELNQDNQVIRVIVIRNEDMLNEKGVEEEQIGIDYCKSIYGEHTKWVQTSYNNRFRNRYAGQTDIYRDDLDVFISRQPYSSWSFNEETLNWESPIPYPNDGKIYYWGEDLYQSEKTNGWVLFPQ